MSRPAPLPAAVAALTAWELRVTARRGENLLVTLIIPVSVLVFFTAVPVMDLGSDDPVRVLLPGSISLAVIATGLVSLAISTGYERGYGVLKRLGGSPLPRSGVIGAKAVAVAVTVILQATLLIAVGAMLGWRPVEGTSPVVVGAALVLGALAFSALGLAMAGRLRPEATMAASNGLFLACLLVGGIVVPLELLPAAVPILAQLLPPAALTEALRVGLDGGDATLPLVVLAAWAAGATILAARTFRWE